VSDWAWEFLPDAEQVVCGLPVEVPAEIEKVAAELAVVNSMVYPEGEAYTGQSPGLRIEQRPHVLISCLTDVRGERVLIVRVNRLG
jgi:hypothetical protein